MYRKVLILFVPILLLTMLLVAACGDSTDESTPQPETTSPSVDAAQTARPRATVPQTQPQPEQVQPTQDQPAEKLQVVATTNILADWVRAVGQDRVDVLSLLPANADPHTYQPGARDITRIADADRVFSIGLSLEAGWLNELIENAAQNPDALVALGDAVDPIQFVEMMEEHGEEGEVELQGRLFIGDGESGALSIVDLEHGDVEQDAFDMGARAGRIYATKSGRFAIAVSGDANTAHIFDGGIYLDPHGDHFDLVEVAPSQLGIDLSGDAPSHLYVGSEWSGIFYDGTGDVVLINEHELEEENDSYVPTRFNAGAQHGGLVVLEDDLFAVTTQHPDYASDPGEYGLPVGADIRDLSGNVLYTAPGCDDLQGDAGNGHMAVFGCVGGALAIEAHDGEYDHVFVPAPDGAPDDFRLTSVWGYHGLDHFFALGSAVGLYIVEPEEEEMQQLIPATEDLRPIQVHIGHGGETLLVVMSDGELRMYDAHDGHLLESKSGFLTSPVEAGFWARPHLATVSGAIFITDSVGGEVLQLDEHDLEVVGHWDVDGAPTKIAFVGIVGGEDEHDDHGDEGDEGHDDHGHGPLDPHFWFDPNRVKIAVNDIAARLSALDPENIGVYIENALEYGRQLDELHAWIQEQVAAVPPERRLLVTSHDTFAYFADVYGFEVIGALIPSLAPDVEPSAEHLAELVEVLREHNAPAVFSETTVSNKLPEALARETGASLFHLYADSLGERGSPAGTYLGMMRANVEVLVEALN